MSTENGIIGEFRWKCACGTMVIGSSEAVVLDGQATHRRKHNIQARAILAGDACLAYRIMRKVPAEGWVPGYNCCPSTTPADGESLEREARKLIAQEQGLI